MHVLANTSNHSERRFRISAPVLALGSCTFLKAQLYAPPCTHVGMHESEPSLASSVNININFNIVINMNNRCCAQAAELEAQQIHQEALASSPAQSQPPAAPSHQAPAQAAISQPSAAASSAILPSARLLCRAQVAKAGGLLACAAALQNQQQASASYALPGRDAAVVKQFLAQAGVLV